MAAPRENLLSLEHLTNSERNTFTKQREHRLKMSRARHLQQRWQELKERELTSQQNNRQMLQQFEEAQDTLKEMLTLTAAMKTIRMEYERYLEESCLRWQQQLKEKTQAAQRKRMEEYLRSCLKNTEERETASSADQPFPPQGSTTINQNIPAPLKHYSPNSHLDYNQDGSPHLSFVQSSWQSRLQSQTQARCPIRAPYQPQGSSHVPPSFLPPHIFTQLHHLTSSPGDRHPRPRLNPPGWAALEPDRPWSWAAGAAGILSGAETLWGQLYPDEPPPEMGIAQVVGEETNTSRASSSKREGGGGGRSSCLSPELDIKPVRLSGGHTESNESSREPSQVSREKRKKREERGRSHCSFSNSQSCSSQESSSAIVIAAVKVVQSSDSDAYSEKDRTSTRRRTRRSGGLAVGSPRDEKVVKGSKGDDPGSHQEESQSTGEELGSLIEESRSEKAENQNPDDKSQSCGEESGSQEEETGSVSIKIENRGGDEIEKQESNSSERSNVGKKDEEDRDDDDAEEKENSQTDEEQEERDGEQDHEASERKSATEEDEETGAEDEEDEEKDEDERDGGEDNVEEEESDEEEQREDLAGDPEEERDSDDSIISPQDKSKKMHIIPEASEEDEEEGSKTGSSDDDSNEISDEDDVENLLAPQKQSQKTEEKDLKAHEQPKAICDNVEIFQVEPNKSTKSDHPSDSDEFDNFYG